MKKYDNEKFPPQEINGFKSKLEYITSKYLKEVLKVKALYEPFTYKTIIGNYTPDFYIPEMNLFIECKPGLEFANLKLYQQFCKEKQSELLLITPTHSYFIEKINEDVSDFNVINCYKKCSKCNKTSLLSTIGQYRCRYIDCNFYDGDNKVKSTEFILEDKEVNAEIIFGYFYILNGGHY
jgi:hypothetical protein